MTLLRRTLAVFAFGYVTICHASLDEVEVVARRKPEQSQRVGLSISTLDRERFHELTRGTLDGLAAQLTNTQAYATSTYLQTVHLRGVGLNEFQGQYDSPVAQHVDGVYISKPWMLARRQYDLQRVEVLKGPQGTLFGRNTTGGSINYYTQPPTASPESAIELGADEHERIQISGFVNGAVNRELLGRFSFLREFGSGGPQENLFTGRPHGKPNLTDLRAQALWKRDGWSIRTLLHGGKDQSEKITWKGPGIFNTADLLYCPALLDGRIGRDLSQCSKTGGHATQNDFPDAEFEPRDHFTVNQNTPAAVDDSFYGGYVALRRDLANAVMNLTLSYEYYERIHLDDSQTDPLNSTSTHYYNELHQQSQEINFLGDLSDRTSYVVGLYRQHDDLEQVDGSDLSEQQVPGITPPFADQFFSQFDQDLTTMAVYGQLRHETARSVYVEIGLRYTQDEISIGNALQGLGNLPMRGKKKLVTPCLITTYPDGPIGSPACPFLGPAAAPLFDDRDDENLAWRLGVEWQRLPNLLYYASISSGHRSGGFSLPFAGPATKFAPEDLLAGEIGFKREWPAKGLRLNGAVFQYEYDDVQVNVDDPVSPLVPITRNIGKQVSTGAEMDLEYAGDSWGVRQAVGWMNAEYEDSERVVTTYSGVIPLDGKQPVNTPSWTYTGSVNYRRPIFDDWTLGIGVDYRWIDARYLEAANQVFDRAPSYWVVNGRMSLTSADSRWSVAVYGTNLTNEAYLTYMNNISFLRLEIYGEPRTLGVLFRYTPRRRNG